MRKLRKNPSVSDSDASRRCLGRFQRHSTGYCSRTGVHPAETTADGREGCRPRPLSAQRCRRAARDCFARAAPASRSSRTSRAARCRVHLENGVDELSVVQVLGRRAQKVERADAEHAARAAAAGAASRLWPSRRERAEQLAMKEIKGEDAAL